MPNQNIRELDIAIIGMSCCFPGAENIDAFWRNIRDGVESISFFTDSEIQQNDNSLLNNPNYVKAGAVLPNIDQFDASFFGYSPKEAAMMDPQQRIFLECAWEAFENAGYNPDIYTGLVGVYAGSSLSTYLANNINRAYLADNAFIEADMLQFQIKQGNDRNYLPTRVSYKLNLKGPSVNVQTACSTSLVAVHLACQSLLNGECDMALAGGVSIIVPDKGGYLYEEGMIRSPDGHCRPFDVQATGTLFGNGVGIVLLKPLSQAISDGDRIVAAIKGGAINNDGSLKVGFTAPSIERQADVIEEALAVAEVDAGTITYVEAHGTGTKLGDPIEIAALTQAFYHSSDEELYREQCAIGSVKSNIGHLDEAAGIAGLIKVALALKHKQIPPSLHFNQPNPQIDFENSPFYVNTELTEWLPYGVPRRAGVSSFGMGGTNCHLVLEEAPIIDRSLEQFDRDRHLLALSAKTPQALDRLAQRYIYYLEEHGQDTTLADICFTANSGRKHFSHRAAFVAKSSDRLREQLERFLDGGADEPEIRGQVRRVAFLFTGQGSQYVDMGRQLYETQPIFRQTIDRCDRILQPYLNRSLLRILYPEPEQHSPINETAYTQPALFAIEYALYQLWKSWGIQPDVVMGHSVGEYVAACVAGVFSLEDGLKLIAERGRLMQALPRDGSMVSVMGSEARVATLIRPYEEQVTIAAINGPQSVVISGEKEAIDIICAALETEGLKIKRLNVSHAFHSPLMETMLADFERVTRQVSYSEPKIELISNITGQLASHEVTAADYWVRHVRQPVRFATGIESLKHEGANLFIEIGPKPILLGMGCNCLPEHEGFWLPSLRPKQDDWQQLLSSLRDLYLAGVAVDWVGFDKGYARRRVPLPTYPWQRERHWIKASDGTSGQMKSHLNVRSQIGHPLLGQRLYLPATQEIRFQSYLSKDSPAWMKDHRTFGAIIAPGVSYLEMAFAAGSTLVRSSNLCLELEDVVIPQALIFPEDGQGKTVHLVLQPEETANYAFQIFSFTDPVASRFDEKSPEAQIDGWSIHASGKLLIKEGESAERVDLSALRAKYNQAVSVEGLYQGKQAIDLGPSFWATEQLWRHETSGLGKFTLPKSLHEEAQMYHLHPALVDAGLLALLVISPGEKMSYFPIAVKRVRFYGSCSPTTLWCQAQLRPDESSSKHFLKGDVYFFDDEGQLVVAMEELLFTKTARKTLLRVGEPEWKDWLYEVVWRPKVRFGLLPDYLPTPDKIRKSLETKLAKSIVEAHLASYGVAFTQLERLSLAYVYAAFQQMGWAFELGERFSTAQKISELGIVDRHQQLFARLLDMLVEAEILLCYGAMTEWEVISHPETIDPQVLLYDLEAKEAEAEILLVSRCGAKLAEVLRGECDPIKLLDTTTLSKLYREAPILGVTNTLVQEAVLSALEQLPVGRGWRILEIGAGTGGTTSYLLPQLPVDRTEYVFTDISAFFIAKAEERFKDYPFVHYQVLDIEQAPQAQGFEPHQYDLIVAADVLHATSDLRQTLTHVRQLLAPGGILLLMEDSEPARWADLTFGLTEGWWRFTDRDLRPNHPLLSPAQWQTLLQEMGFSQTTALWPEIDSPHKLPREAVIVARNEPAIRTPRKWLLLADEEIGGLLAKRLRGEGEDCTLLLPGEKYAETDSQTFTINPASLEEWKQLLKRVPNIQEIVHCWSMVSTDLDAATLLNCRSMLYLVQALASYSETPRLSLVTRGTQAVNEHHVQNLVGSALWGMGKVIALEYPELQVVQVDLDPNGTVEAQVEALKGELLVTEEPASATSAPPREEQIAFRDQTRYVARLSRKNDEADNQEPLTLHNDGSYLIAGGLGGLGLLVARFLVEHGARHLVLVGRSGARKEQQTQLSELSQRGASVKVVQADVADAEQLAQAVATATSPPLRGVIHAAGTLHDGILQQQSWQTFEKVMASKVAGAWNLHTLTKDRPLDFFLLFSSATSLLGNAGQTNYAAANAFLDALASYRRAQGLPSLSINWGTWSEVGIAARLGLDKLSPKQGEGTITPEQGWQILEHLLKDRAHQVGVIPIDWPQFLSRQLVPQPFFSDFTSSSGSSSNSPALITTQTDACVDRNLRQQLENASPKEALALLQAHVSEQVAQVIGVDGLALLEEPEVGFFTLGMDSLTSIELRNRLQISFGCSLPVTLLFDYPTPKALMDYLAQELLPDHEDPLNQAVVHASLSMIEHSTLVPIQPHGSKPALFFVPGILGTVLDFSQLAHHLGSEQPFYGLRSLGLDEDVTPYTRITQIAAHHIKALQAVQPQGPYLLGGYSFGGKVAFEIAQQLQDRGHEVSLLALLDVCVPIMDIEKEVAHWDEAMFISRLATIYENILGQKLELLDKQLNDLIEQLEIVGYQFNQAEMRRILQVYKANMLSYAEYVPQNLHRTPITLLRASLVGEFDFLPDEAITLKDPNWGWGELAEGSRPIELHLVPGNHFTMMSDPHVQVLAEQLRVCLEKALYP